MSLVGSSPTKEAANNQSLGSCRAFRQILTFKGEYRHVHFQLCLSPPGSNQPTFRPPSFRNVQAEPEHCATSARNKPTTGLSAVRRLGCAKPVASKTDGRGVSQTSAASSGVAAHPQKLSGQKANRRPPTEQSRQGSKRPFEIHHSRRRETPHTESHLGSQSCRVLDTDGLGAAGSSAQLRAKSHTFPRCGQSNLRSIENHLAPCCYS
jgi:hypothetical protein